MHLWLQKQFQLFRVGAARPRSSSAFLPSLPTSVWRIFTPTIASRLPLKYFLAFILFHIPPPFTFWDLNLGCSIFIRTTHDKSLSACYSVWNIAKKSLKLNYIWREWCFMWFCDLINTMMHNQGSLHCRFVFTVFKFPHLAILTIRLQAPSSSPLPSLLPPPPYLLLCPPLSHTLPTLFCLSSYLFFPRLQPCVAALRGTLCCPQPLSAVLRVPLLWLHLFLSFSTTTTLYYPPLPTSWQVHTLCTTCLPSSLSVDPPHPPVCSSGRRLGAVRPVYVSVCLSWIFARDPAGIGQLWVASSVKSKMLHPCRHLLDVLHVTDGSFKINTERI